MFGQFGTGQFGTTEICVIWRVFVNFEEYTYILDIHCQELGNMF